MVEGNWIMAQILDFYDLIVNQIIGDPTLFILLTLFVIGIILVMNRAPNTVISYFTIAVAGILAIQFPILRWGVAIFGLGFVGWIFMRLRRE